MNVTTVYQGITGFSKEGNASGNGTETFPLEKATNFFAIVILFISMISVGCSMEISKIKYHFLKPNGAVIALVAQFGIMPLAAFCIAKILRLDPIKALTVLICGCCPGGSLSNVFSLALKGDINLSIVMTICSNVAALGLMPLLLYIYCQGIEGLQSAIPYVGIIIALALILAPCGIGIIFNHYKPQYSVIVTKVGLSIVIISSIIMFTLCGIDIKDRILLVLTADLLGAAALLPMTGFMLGYAMSKICQLNDKCSRTISIETGCQNINLCFAIIKVVFPPEVIGPLYLFPLLYIILQCSEVLLLVLCFRCYEKFKAQPQDMKVWKTIDDQLQAERLQCQHHSKPGT